MSGHPCHKWLSIQNTLKWTSMRSHRCQCQSQMARLTTLQSNCLPQIFLWSPTQCHAISHKPFCIATFQPPSPYPLARSQASSASFTNSTTWRKVWDPMCHLINSAKSEGGGRLKEIMVTVMIMEKEIVDGDEFHKLVDQFISLNLLRHCWE